MREIKFRAWLPDEKKMGVPFVLQEEIAPVGGETEYGTWLPETIFMQYTGLKDRDGLEIYEGDIVIVSHNGYEFKNVVDWSMHPEGAASGWDIPDAWRRSEVELIGNIYENPQLLEPRA